MKTLLSPLTFDPGVAACFSDTARVQAMLDVEVALAEAGAAAGVIPAAAVPPIRTAARAGLFDFDRLAGDAADAGNLLIPLLAQLKGRVGESDASAVGHVHVGASSQDIIDTGLVLQLRAAIPIVSSNVRRAVAAAARHAREHRSTMMAGRTWMQQATPTTFGLKAAGWLEAMERGRRAVDERAREACILQFGGSSGTLAALGPQAAQVSTELGRRLDLPVPTLPWHAHRDRQVRLACALAVLTGTLGKIGRDLALLAQTEVAEAHEKPQPGRGGSSSMPHKRNPIASSVALAASVRVPGLLASLLAAMPQEHERGLGGWQAEWDVVPEIVLLTSGAARAIADALEGLVVDAAHMARNLELTAEAVRKLLPPDRHLGLAETFVDEVLARWEKEGGPHA